MKKLWTLFWEMFKIALCVVGGGFAILAVADEVFSRRFRWTEEGELFANLPVFQMVPGIIAGNTAIYVGRKVAGVPGAAVALVGVFLPSVIVFSAVSAGYSLIPLGNPVLDGAFLGLRAALTGIIAAMAVRSWPKCIDGAYAATTMLLALVAIGPLALNPALVVAVAVVCGVVARFAEGETPRSARRFMSAFWALPLIFLKYGTIAFGGGYVLVPVYLGDFVGASAPYLQLAEREFADVMALTQMTPGPVAVNCATFFGYRMGLADGLGAAGGVGYAVVATICLLIPGSVLLYLALGSLERFRASRVVQGVMRGVKPVTIAMMLNALWAFAGMSAWTRGAQGDMVWHPVAAVLVVLAAAAVFTRKVGVVKLIFACAAMSAAVAAARTFLR